MTSKEYGKGLARAAGGALLFSFPLLMTMEMWQLGFAIERERLLLFVLVSLPMLPDYIAALRNNTGSFPGLDYSVQDIPFIAIPFIAWMARTETPTARSRTGSAGHR